jgi:ABC-type multidrug transport system ATPase subunit
MGNRIKIVAKSLSKSYNGVDHIFSGLDFEINQGDVFGILGRNGSGKTTLLKILAGLITPSAGNVELTLNGGRIKNEDKVKHLGFVAPYLTLFEEFHSIEHLKIVSMLRGITFSEAYCLELLDFFDLALAKDKLIREYSSGMKQRFKFVVGLIHQPMLLFLDEPFTNLDESGIQKVTTIINNFRNAGKIVVVATNDQREANLCNITLRLSVDLPTNEPDFNSAV